MMALNNPQDRFFKAVFGRTEVAAEFLARYLPPASGREAGLDAAAGRKGCVSRPGVGATYSGLAICSETALRQNRLYSCVCCSNTRVMSNRAST